MAVVTGSAGPVGSATVPCVLLETFFEKVPIADDQGVAEPQKNRR